MLTFLLVAVFFLLGVIVVKLLWLVFFLIGAGRLSSQQSTTNLRWRVAYLIHQVVEHPVTWQQMPASLLRLSIPKQFRGEWALVTHSMTAACLTNIAFLRPESQPDALVHVETLIKRVLHPDLRAFDVEHWNVDPLHDLDGARGHIGYLGHLNFMLAAYHTLGGSDSKLRVLFKAVTSHLSGVLHGQASLNGETYPGETYISDNAVVAASLAIYDRLYPADESGTAQAWLDALNGGLRDSRTSLPVFSLDSMGQPLQMSRGSGCAWTIFYLGHVDLESAQTDYERLKRHFWRSYAPGLAAICEWPGCRGGIGDLDSGPLLLGMSPAATSFAIAGARLAGDQEGERQLVRTAELAGFSVQWQGRRRYLTAPLIGNAILSAMLSATRWDCRWINQ